MFIFGKPSYNWLALISTILTVPVYSMKHRPSLNPKYHNSHKSFIFKNFQIISEIRDFRNVVGNHTKLQKIFYGIIQKSENIQKKNVWTPMKIF